jgi:hypothetical protein
LKHRAILRKIDNCAQKNFCGGTFPFLGSTGC